MVLNSLKQDEISMRFKIEENILNILPNFQNLTVIFKLVRGVGRS